MKHINILLLFVANIVNDSNPAKILGVVPTPSFSHQVFFRPIWVELSLRGHQITVVTTDPMKNSSLTNLTEIDLHDAYKLWTLSELGEKYKDHPYKMLNEITNLMLTVIDFDLSHPEVKQLIEDKNQHFDVVMIEGLMPEMFAFSTRFNAPLIAMVSLDAASALHDRMGNIAHPVIYPDFQLPFIPPLNFAQRVASFVFKNFLKFYGSYIVAPKENKLISKHFGEHYPSVHEVMNNISLLFINTNPAFEMVRPLGPNTIPIGGGTHMNDQKPLPKDIKDFLDSATNGAIYFSLGSNVKGKHISDNLRNIFSDTFNKLPYKVLWKFDEKISSLPKNVKRVEWCQQQDVLRHPNIKLFITQGGLQSTEEAIMSKVPLIGMPFFMDQEPNVRKIVERGIGLSVDKNTLTREILEEKINEVINNNRYKNKVEELAKVVIDQPMTGLERAVWWTEYVIRHKGAEILKSHQIPDYQYYLLDILAFLLILITMLFYLLKFILKLIVKLVCKMKNKVKKL